MPPHDETSPAGHRSGSVRRPPPARATRSTGGGRGRTTSVRAGGPRQGGARDGAGRPTASGGGRPPTGRPPGSRATGGGGGGRGGNGGRGNGRAGRPGKGAPRTKQQRRRRRLKIGLAALGGLIVLMGVFVGVVYATTTVPDPDTVQAAQTTTVLYSDGTQMARLGHENRTNVRLDQVSEAAQHAVLAAENRSFYSDPGISFTGIIRAVWNNLTGGSTQGGSTITQQYVKKAILQDSSQTFSRKFKELFLAVKLDNTYTKNQILESYLNTIYFGRGAYGIEAAANTYFGVHASELTAQQSAVLAVLIRNPSYYDPANNPQDAKDRWGAVLDGMVQQHWLSAADRQASQYPQVLESQASSLGIPSGPEGLVVQRVISELKAKGYSDQQIRAGGLRVTTTVSKKYEDAAVAAVNDVMKGQPDNLRQALVAVDPRTGAVVAYYGGPKGSGKDAIDYAQAQRAPGSSMKPYTLATALQQGISVDARRNGSSPQTFPDREKPVRNAGNEACADCTLKQAITESLNTTFYGLAYEVGPAKVRKTALAAMHLPETWQFGQLKGDKTLAQDGKTGGAIGIGQYEVRPVDQAVGFATFASGGIQRDPYFVSKVTDSEGKVLLQNNGSPGQQVIPGDVAHDVTFALEDVAAWSKRSLDGKRPVASKTGTQGLNDTDNSDAWMVGYTPSISTSVWQGSDTLQPIKNAQGRIIYGAGLPGAIWQEFMNTVLKGTPVEKLPDSAIIKGDTGHPVNPVPEPPSSPPPAPDTTTSTTTPPADNTTTSPTTTPPTTTPKTTPPTTTPTTTSPASGTPAPGVPEGGAGSQAGQGFWSGGQRGTGNG